MPSFIGFWELLALAAVLLLLFGPRRLPEVGRSLGRGMREFKESITTPLDQYQTSDQTTPAHLQEAPGAPQHARRAAAPAADLPEPDAPRDSAEEPAA